MRNEKVEWQSVTRVTSCRNLLHQHANLIPSIYKVLGACQKNPTTTPKKNPKSKKHTKPKNSSGWLRSVVGCIWYKQLSWGLMSLPFGSSGEWIKLGSLPSVLFPAQSLSGTWVPPNFNANSVLVQTQVFTIIDLKTGVVRSWQLPISLRDAVWFNFWFGYEKRSH